MKAIEGEKKKFEEPDALDQGEDEEIKVRKVMCLNEGFQFGKGKDTTGSNKHVIGFPSDNLMVIDDFLFFLEMATR